MKISNNKKIIKYFLRLCWLIIISKIVMIKVVSSREYKSWFYENYEKYKISAEQMTTIYPHERTPIRIHVEIENKKRVFETHIDNNGRTLDEKNYNIEVFDEYILLEILDYDQNVKEIFRFYFSDYSRNNKG